MSHIEEENSLTWLAARSPSAPVKVAFVLQLQTFWPLFESLALALKNRDGFAPTVLLTQYIQDGAVMEHIKYAEKELRDSGIAIATENTYNIHKERPDIAFFVNPYTATRKIRFLPELLRMHSTRTAVIPYCTEVMGDMNFLSLYFHACVGNWRYFTSSEMCQNGYVRIKKFPLSACPIAGNPEYDQVLNTPKDKLLKYQDIKKEADGRRILLWTPHYSAGWNTWDRLGLSMIEYFASLSSELFMVLRPHQIISKQLIQAAGEQSEGCSPKMREAVRAMRNAGNFYFDTEGAGIESVYAADGMVSDLSSMLTKGMALEKHVFFLKNAGHDDAGPASGIMNEHMHTGFDLGAVQQFTEMLLYGEDPLLPVPEEVREYFCGPVDGNSGKRIADMLEQYFFRV